MQIVHSTITSDICEFKLSRQTRALRGNTHLNLGKASSIMKAEDSGIICPFCKTAWLEDTLV
jgi:hypothetical protein